MDDVVTLPRFTAEIKNKTVTAGRLAVLTCKVENLGNYKVKKICSIPLNICFSQMQFLGGLGASRHPDDIDHSSQHHNEKSTRFFGASWHQALEPAHYQRPGVWPGLVHVPGQHWSYEKQAGFPRSCRWAQILYSTTLLYQLARMANFVSLPWSFCWNGNWKLFLKHLTSLH